MIWRLRSQTGSYSDATETALGGNAARVPPAVTCHFESTGTAAVPSRGSPGTTNPASSGGQGCEGAASCCGSARPFPSLPRPARTPGSGGGHTRPFGPAAAALRRAHTDPPPARRIRGPPRLLDEEKPPRPGQGRADPSPTPLPASLPRPEKRQRRRPRSPPAPARPPGGDPAHRHQELQRAHIVALGLEQLVEDADAQAELLLQVPAALAPAFPPALLRHGAPAAADRRNKRPRQVAPRRRAPAGPGPLSPRCAAARGAERARSQRAASRQEGDAARRKRAVTGSQLASQPAAGTSLRAPCPRDASPCPCPCPLRRAARRLRASGRPRRGAKRASPQRG